MSYNISISKKYILENSLQTRTICVSLIISSPLEKRSGIATVPAAWIVGVVIKFLKIVVAVPTAIKIPKSGFSGVAS